MVDKVFGELSSAQTTPINGLESALYDKAESASVQPSAEGNLLWEYRNEHSIDGIQVKAEDRNLPIDSDSLLQEAFQIERTPYSKLFILDPDKTDSCAEYNEVLEKAYRGEAVILTEDRQYDAAHGRFVVWVRYDYICYKLNRRFDFLRE